MSSTEPRKRVSALVGLIYILKPQKLALAVVLVWSVVLSCLNASVPYALKLAVDTIVSGKNLRFLFYIAGAVLGIYLVRNFVYYLSKSRIVLLAERVAFDLRSEMMAHLHRMSVGYYKRQKPAMISSRLIRDVESIKEFISSELTKMFVNGLMIAVAVAIIIHLNLLLAAVAVSLLPLNLLIYYVFRGSITQSARTAKEHVSSIGGDLVELFTGVETVRAAVSESKEQEKFASSMQKGMSAQIRERRFYLFQKISADMLSGVSLVLLLSVGGYLVMAGKMSTGDFVGFYAYMGMLYPLAVNLVADAGKFASTAASVDRVYDILRTAPEVREYPHARPHKIEEGKIEFRNVGFSHGDQELLQNVSFTIEHGEHVLITGPSGCGKSSLLSLIPRFYDCQSGAIIIDGIDIKEFTLASLRGQIGFVLQQCFLFNSSVLENIHYARPSATPGEVIQAAKRAYAHSFIQQLPRGYGTRVGEGGVQLSFGERQRIGIARAMLKDPRIFILDEALASVDPDSGAYVARELVQLARERTMLVVTHTPAVFQSVQKELRFEDGRVNSHYLARSVD